MRTHLHAGQEDQHVATPLALDDRQHCVHRRLDVVQHGLSFVCVFVCVQRGGRVIDPWVRETRRSRQANARK